MINDRLTGQARHRLPHPEPRLIPIESHRTNLPFNRALSKFWMALCFLLASAASVLSAPELLTSKNDDSRAKRPPEIEFDRDIFPILQTHCFECHSEQSNEGDLRLDDEQLAKLGGHTGSQLLVGPAEKSELYQRLISTDPSYRMPKRAEPLPEAEIALIKAWLDQGAKWGSRKPSVNSDRESLGIHHPVSLQDHPAIFESLGERLSDFLENSSRPRYRRISGLIWPLIGWTLLLIFTALYKSRRIWRAWTRRGSAPPIASADSPLSKRSLLEAVCDRLLLWRWLLAGLLMILGLTAFFYQQGIIEELEANLQKAKSSIRSQPPLRITQDRKNLTLPIHPDHPPRLGGTYYRGNDERDPALFNGGVYRTATMELSLENEQNQPLKWGAAVSNEPLWIKLVIVRAPRTTAALFSSHIFQQTNLRRFRETDLISGNDRDESEEVGFTVVQPEQSWMARVPLEPSSDWKAGRNSGVIYLAYGSQEIDGYQGRVHYGIRYELQVKDGVLSPESVLWMGAIYDLGGRVLVPQDKEVLLHHWFDYRPLPEIETENSEDPVLLGIPEHYGN